MCWSVCHHFLEMRGSYTNATALLQIFENRLISIFRATYACQEDKFWNYKNAYHFFFLLKGQILSTISYAIPPNFDTWQIRLITNSYNPPIISIPISDKLENAPRSNRRSAILLSYRIAGHAYRITELRGKIASPLTMSINWGSRYGCWRQHSCMQIESLWVTC